jgi:dUTP pyrophosphatase
MRIKLLSPNAKLPTLGTAAAAGFDLYASKSCIIEPGQCVLVHTGIALEIPNGFWGGIYSRSGLSTKKGLRLANGVGVIDSDYRGEIMVALYNDSSVDQEINTGERIAQLIFHQQWTMIPDEDGNIWQVVEDLSETDRGAGGFGSTGTN